MPACVRSHFPEVKFRWTPSVTYLCFHDTKTQRTLSLRKYDEFWSNHHRIIIAFFFASGNSGVGWWRELRKKNIYSSNEPYNYVVAKLNSPLFTDGEKKERNRKHALTSHRTITMCVRIEWNCCCLVNFCIWSRIARLIFNKYLAFGSNVRHVIESGSFFHTNTQKSAIDSLTAQALEQTNSFSIIQFVRIPANAVRLGVSLVRRTWDISLSIPQGARRRPSECSIPFNFLSFSCVNSFAVCTLHL